MLYLLYFFPKSQIYFGRILEKNKKNKAFALFFDLYKDKKSKATSPNHDHGQDNSHVKSRLCHRNVISSVI